MRPDAPRPADAPPPDARRPRRRWSLVVLGVAALAASWNPAAAPFGLVVGAATAVLAAFALRRSPGRRTVPALALGLSLLAIGASGVVVAATAGSLGIELSGEPIVKGRTSADLDRVLSEAAERTRSRRQRAVDELDAMSGKRAPPPRDEDRR